jgi:hypothetical protein
LTNKRFNELISVILRHPVPVQALMRLGFALQTVLEQTGPKGDEALEAFVERLRRADEEPFREELSSKGRKTSDK